MLFRSGWNFLNSLVATCPNDFEACITASPLVLDVASPSGGVYSGNGVYYNAGNQTYMFNPSVAGLGSTLITYQITTPTQSSCNFTINVVSSPNAPCPGNMAVCAGSPYIPLPPGQGYYTLNGQVITGITPVNQGNYLNKHFVVNACGSDSCTFNILVYPSPTIACSGNLAFLHTDPLADLAASALAIAAAGRAPDPIVPAGYSAAPLMASGSLLFSRQLHCQPLRG